jgi:hypothetical protein
MKTKDVVWIVSNCNTPSKREKYVKEMQKIINVDIFGRCGKPCVEKGIDCIQNLGIRSVSHCPIKFVHPLLLFIIFPCVMRHL